MSTPVRLEFEGTLYHVTSRCDRREDIYETDGDRNAFLGLLGDVCERVTAFLFVPKFVYGADVILKQG